ncbi:ASCH domain-containing protein [Paenibacillus rhizophilus]|uniref:ASCH domain-containing protein n=1 Tax=Paenibacillus rhizophilus TaxID=1850366 RepID=A0A3N9PYV8_9BACL|nr:ASCH domain-containing protein [Paenibacillus rhizophilus]RQW11592.1 ASCH domain-containing protein [Paenibacillus rhizophilus]
MRCITIWQPWATLIALGEKKFETRSWATKHRDSIAIHAGKKVDKAICQKEPFRSVLAKHGYTVNNLPTGSVVAVCRLADCLQVIEGCGGEVKLESPSQSIAIGDKENAFGLFDAGRFAWELTDVRLLPKPIPAKGMQGLWNWEGNK